MKLPEFSAHRAACRGSVGQVMHHNTSGAAVNYIKGYRCDMPSLDPCATLVGALRADVARWATAAPHLRSDS